MADDMEAIIEKYEDHSNLRAAVIRALGPTFSAGQDLKAAAQDERATTPVAAALASWRSRLSSWRNIGQGEGLAPLVKQGQAVEQLANLLQPIITTVHGHCDTGAFGIAPAGDLAVATASAKFTDTHPKWALTPV